MPAVAATPLRYIAWQTESAIVQLLQVAATVLPQPISFGCGRFLARSLWRLLGKRRSIAKKEATRVFGRAGDQVAAESFEHLMEMLVRTLRVRPGLRHALDHLDIPDPGPLERALAMRRGVIAVTGHFGDWESFNFAMAAAGRRVHVVRRVLDNPILNRAFVKFWERRGTGFIPRHGALRTGLRALRNGDILTIYVDQDARRRGVFVPFLGCPASTVRSPALLSLKSGAPILGFAVTRLPGGRSRLVFDEPFVADATLPADQAIVDATRRFTKNFEAHVRAAPEQWMWIHRRWKTRTEEAVAVAGDADESGEA